MFTRGYFSCELNPPDASSVPPQELQHKRSLEIAQETNREEFWGRWVANDQLMVASLEAFEKGDAAQESRD